MIETSALDFALRYALLQQGDEGPVHPITLKGDPQRHVILRMKRSYWQSKNVEALCSEYANHYGSRQSRILVLYGYGFHPLNRLSRWINECQGFDLDFQLATQFFSR